MDVTPPSAVTRLSPHSPSHAIKSATCQTLLVTSCVSHAQREGFYDGYRRNFMNWKQHEILSNFLLFGLRWLLHWLLMQDDPRCSEERIREPEKPAINRLKAETISGNVGFRAYHTRNPFLVFLDCPSSSVWKRKDPGTFKKLTFAWPLSDLGCGYSQRNTELKTRHEPLKTVGQRALEILMIFTEVWRQKNKNLRRH